MSGHVRRADGRVLCGRTGNVETVLTPQYNDANPSLCAYCREPVPPIPPPEPVPESVTHRQGVYNTAVPVVANVLADSPEHAYTRLAAALRHAGFEVMDESGLPTHESQPLMPPFEAETGTEPDL